MKPMFANYMRAKQNEARHGLEIFGTRINVVDGMVRLNDIRNAYLLEIGEDPKTSRTKRLDKWDEMDSVQELRGYMLDEIKIPPEGVSKTVRGKGKAQGTYVCRELAHNYAMYCDARYAYHVLRAFDQLVQCDPEEAWKTASKVCSEIAVQEWRARLERIEKEGFADPEDVLKMQMQSIAMEICRVSDFNVFDFRDYLFDKMRGSLILERVLNVLEFSWKCEHKDMQPEEAVMEHFHTDPEFPLLVTAVKEYFNA